jgi:EVE domain
LRSRRRNPRCWAASIEWAAMKRPSVWRPVVTLTLPCEIVLSFVRDADCAGGIRVYVTQSGAWTADEEVERGLPRGGAEKQGTRWLPERSTDAALPNVWIFQASPKFSNVKGAVRSVEEPVCLVRQYREEIRPGDKVYLWECGSRGGIIALAEVVEMPRVQPEPADQLAFIREGEKFAGDQLRVKLRIRKQIAPGIPRSFLLSRPELAGLSILRCARGTNFRVTREQAAALDKVVGEFEAFFPNGNGSQEKRIVFAEG